MSSDRQAFSIPEARKLVSDLFTPQPWIYWLDLLLTLTVAYGAALVFLEAPAFSWQQLICYPIAGIGLFRAALFMHEVVHFRQGQMVAFKVAWNVLAGIPLLMPSFLYESHLAHHNTRHYGTGNDGEYLPLGVGSYRNILRFLAQILFQPLLVGLRFFLGTPISFLHPKLREFVLGRMSSFVINFSYQRDIPRTAPRRIWAIVEIACCLRAAGIFLGPALIPHIPWTRILLIYALALLALGLNHFRTLVAHRYLSTGEKMSFAEQLEDSINISGTPILTELFFPVGLRYHALHHLFPSIPYHNLGIAHRRLIDHFPAGSAYHRVTFPSFWAALRELIQNSRKAMANPPPAAELWYARRRQLLEPVPAELEETGAQKQREEPEAGLAAPEPPSAAKAT